MPTKHAKQTSQDCLKLASKAWNALTHMTLLHTDTFTQKPFDTQKLQDTRTPFTAQTALTHTLPLWHRNTFYTETLLHTHYFTQRRFNTQTLLHTDTFTHRSFYTQTLLRTDALFTHKHLLHRNTLYTQTRVTHKHFYTQNTFTLRQLLHTHRHTHTPFCTQTLLHTDPLTHRQKLFFTHKPFYTQTLWHRNPLPHRSCDPRTPFTFTQKHFYTQTGLHSNTFAHRSFYTHTQTHTLVRQNVCSRGSYWFVIFCSWKGRCTQTCSKQWQIEYGRRCEWITEFRNRNGLMAGTSDWSGQISPALIQCLRWCKTEWAACTPCLKTEKLKYWKTEKFANPLETGVDPTHKGLSPLVFVGHNALWISHDKAKPFCTYNRDSACNELCAWQDGNEYLRIKWARLFSPLKRNRRVPAETLSRNWWMSGNL